MADTKLPLTTWFRAMHLMSSTKQCISAVELGRRLGVSYPTAWYLHKRLRHAMTEESHRCQLGAPAEGGWTPIGDCRKFRVRAGMMGRKEIPDGPTQGSPYT